MNTEIEKNLSKKADKEVGEISNTINLSGKSRPGPHMGGGMGAIRLKGATARDFKGTLKRLLSFLMPYKMMMIVSLALTIISTVFAVVSPKLLGDITSELQISVSRHTAFDFYKAAHIITVLIVLYLLSWIFDYARAYIMAGLTQKLVRDLRRRVDQKIGKLTFKYLDENKIGDIMSKATNDIDNISTALQTSFTDSVAAIVTIVGVTTAMLLIDPIITLICVVTIPLGTIITTIIVRKSQKFFKRQAAYLGLINAAVEESFSGHKIIKAFGREKKKIDEFTDVSEKYRVAASKAQYASAFTYPLTAFVGELAFIAICLVGGLKVLGGSMLIGDVQALIHYSQRVSNPVTQITNMMTILQTTAASAERIFDLLDEEEHISDCGKEITKPVRGAVTFENVSFRYVPDQPLIENFNLRVEPGQNIAIVGHTGAGKTTLVNLLMRFYEVTEGTIRIDGIDIRNITLDSLHNSLGMVLQDTWLFEGTIADNIAYGAKDPKNVTRAEIIAAAKIAMADSFIRAMPDGYDTMLNEETDDLSQGQKQLLTIARAVIAAPDILILDEATSSVDTRTEQLIQTAMERMMQNRTSFIIAHRLSTIRNAQMIIVMENGSIVEAGSHDELIKKNGAYCELYNSQFAGQVI